MGIFDKFKKKKQEMPEYLYSEQELNEYEVYIEEQVGHFDEVIHEIVVGTLFIKNVHRSNDFLTLCYQSLCFGRSCCCLPVVG